MVKPLKLVGWWRVLLGVALASVILPTAVVAQDQNQQDDPPTRVARLGYMEGSVSFQPAGETDWVGAVPNRPMTTGDKLWADKDSRAELQLGSAVIRLSANTGISFLNLDDHAAQVQLSSGSINVRVRQLDQGDDFEIDTPNLAFTISQPGSYRLEASEDGTYTVASIRQGGGEATGNGQTYTLHAGQKGTFNGTDSLNADVEDIGGPDQFDNWADGRDHRHDNSRSAQYLSKDVVGYDDLDENGDWHDDSNYGHVWYPHASAGWAPYHQGHWDWIDPWGYTWVDDSSWGYAPFHYGRWVSVEGRWGWVAGPPAERAVYAPALVVFIGAGGGGGGFGANIGWFPLGPREVYVPTYPVSSRYMNQINVSNTTVSTTTVTNVYNTTVINKTTNTTTNITYANRNVQGAVTAVPQRAFASAQPVARAAVVVSAKDIAAAPVSRRVAVAPTREAVLGAKAGTAGRVTAPPAAVASRQVIAKKAPPPPPVPFAKRQQAMAAHPGVPLGKREVQTLRPANAAASRPTVKQAPPGKPATPTMNRAGNQPGNKAEPNKPGQPAPANRPGAAQPGKPEPNKPAEANRPGQPANRPGAPQPGNKPEPNKPAEANRPGQPANRPGAPQPGNKPEPNKPAEANRPGQPANRPGAPQPGNKPEPNKPAEANRPGQPANRPGAPPPGNKPEPNKPAEANRPGQPANRPGAPQPGNKPEANKPAEANRPGQPPANRPGAQPGNKPEPNKPEAKGAEPGKPAPNNRPEANKPASPPAHAAPPAQNNRPEENKPQPHNQATHPQGTPPSAHPEQKPAAKPQTPEEKKQEEQRKKEEKPPGV